MGQAKSTNGASSAVSITTVHKSKGLEYPVVILAGTTYGRPGGDSVLYDEKYGIGMEYIDVDKRIKHSCLSLDLIKYKKAKESKAEEIRLLYVAMTRAKAVSYTHLLPKRTFISPTISPFVMAVTAL